MVARDCSHCGEMLKWDSNHCEWGLRNALNTFNDTVNRQPANWRRRSDKPVHVGKSKHHKLQWVSEWTWTSKLQHNRHHFTSPTTHRWDFVRLDYKSRFLNYFSVSMILTLIYIGVSVWSPWKSFIVIVFCICKVYSTCKKFRILMVRTFKGVVTWTNLSRLNYFKIKTIVKLP